jgi:protein-disulfide isomerase
MDRRRFLAGAAATGAVALAGCTGGGGGGGSGSDGSATPDGTPTEDHPATADLDVQPRLGDGEALIVAFEDPSCTLCRRFERDTYPRIVSDLVEPGEASFVYRGYPIIYPWGEPASKVLEATYDADESAFWALKNHYYAAQSEFTTGNVYAESEAFLSAETDVDAAAVVAAAEAGEYDDAVALDVSAGEELDIGQTPQFYLFSDGVFRTEVRGAQGYDVFAAALGV